MLLSCLHSKESVLHMLLTCNIYNNLKHGELFKVRMWWAVEVIIGFRHGISYERGSSAVE